MNRYIRFFLLLLLLIVFGALLKGLIKVYSADVLAEEASQQFNKGDYTMALELSNAAIKGNPFEPRYYIGRSKTYMALTAGNDESSTRTYKLLALEDIRTAQRLNPYNLLTIKTAIPLYYFLATKDLTKPSGPDNIDVSFVEITQAFYTNIQGRFPNDVGVYVLLYTYSNRLDLVELSNAAKNKIMELRPDLLDWYNFK